MLFNNNTNINYMVHITTPLSDETAICNIVINIILFDLIMTRLLIKNIINMHKIHTIITNVIFAICKNGKISLGSS